MGIIDSLFGNKCKRCNKSRTKNESGICNACEVELKAEKEVKILCPTCKVEMKKIILEEHIIIDKCPACTGVFLGKGELETMQEIAESEASSSNSSGLLMGMVIGSAMSHR